MANTRKIPKLTSLATQTLFHHGQQTGKLVMTEEQYAVFKAHKRKKDIKQLVQYVAYGQQHEAEEMLKDDPELLMLRATVVDYSGRTIKNTTAFQCALGADDLDMCEMFKNYFDQLPNGLKKAIDQFNEFIQCSPKETNLYDFSPLVIAITANRGLEELEKLQEYFKPGIIEKGKHFNIQNFINALRIYYKNYDQWIFEQRYFFWGHGIDYLARLLPACYAQALCQKIDLLVEKNQPLNRSLIMHPDLAYFSDDVHFRDTPYFSIRRNPLYGLCTTFAATRDRELDRLPMNLTEWITPNVPPNLATQFEKLYIVKAAGFVELKRCLQHPSQPVKSITSRCVIS